MKKSTAIRVISLSSAQQRRERFTQDAASASIKWDYFDALKGPEAPLFHDVNLTMVHTGRSLRAGELGCYASHFSLWLWFLSTNHDQLIVLEDDVLVDWNALELLTEHDLAQHGMHVVKLYATHPIKSTTVRYKLYSDHSHLLHIVGQCYGTQAYILTRVGAQALVNSCKKLTMPVDWAMSRYWSYGLPNYAVYPFPVVERWGPSMIGHVLKSAEKKSIPEKLPRIFWRLQERFKRFIADSTRKPNLFGAPTDKISALFAKPEKA